MSNGKTKDRYQQNDIPSDQHCCYTVCEWNEMLPCFFTILCWLSSTLVPITPIKTHFSTLTHTFLHSNVNACLLFYRASFNNNQHNKTTGLGVICVHNAHAYLRLLLNFWEFGIVRLVKWMQNSFVGKSTIDMCKTIRTNCYSLQMNKGRRYNCCSRICPAWIHKFHSNRSQTMLGEELFITPIPKMLKCFYFEWPVC